MIIKDRWITELEIALLLIVAGLAFALYFQSCDTRSGQLAVAQHETAIAQKLADGTTVAFHDTASSFRHAAAAYDTTRHHVRLTDTNWVKVTLERADTAVRRAERTVAAADTALVARDGLESKLRAELALAQHTPRFAVSAAALYDPLSSVPAASLDATVRLIGRVSLLARGEQRFAPGERPHAYLGLWVGL